MKKLIPSDILTSISPDILLQWYTGDGYYSSSIIALGTYGFRVVDQQFLVDLLYQIGVASKIYVKDVGNEISISHRKDNRDHFFNYLLNARGNSLARSELPHKFDTNYRKKDLIEDKQSSDNKQYIVN